MSTIDPKRAALVKALMERDLYAMLSIPGDAGEEEILAAIARRTEWVEETPMRHADRQAELHWVAWAERALVKEPDLRTDYDAALAAKAAGEARAVEARQRVRNLRVARDQLARREAGRAVPIEDKTPKKKAAAPRPAKGPAAPAGAGPEVEAVVDVRAETFDVTETPGGGIEATRTVDVAEVVLMPDGEVAAVEVVDTVTATEDTEGHVAVTETVEVIAVTGDGDATVAVVDTITLTEDGSGHAEITETVEVIEAGGDGDTASPDEPGDL